MNTGTRKGELLSLQWHNINYDNKILKVDFQKAKSGHTRHLPLNTEAFNELIQSQKLSGIEGYVFEYKNSQPLKGFPSPWAVIVDKTNITHFCLYDLRHDFASKLVMANVDLNTVRELLGHSDLKMTLSHVYLAPKHKAGVVNLFC